jgi:UDP-N-acetylmuramoyl-tripeptide--D-alanyl-D-alanine ligase
LDDLDGVRREEASIVTGLNPRGCLIVNGDDRELVSLVSRYSGQIIKFGLNTTGNDLFATDIECDHTGVHFNLNGNPRRRLFVPLLGRHSACNALAAIAVGKKMNIPDDAIVESLANAHTPDMRLQLSKVNGVTVLNDAYNANPNSTRAAIETLVALPARGRRVAVLGDMLELGKQSDAYHKETGVLAANSNLDLLICVGKKAKLIAASAKAAGMEAPRIVTYPDAAAAARGVTRRVRGSDLILLKASRSVGLEAVAKAIEERDRKFTRKAI